MVPRPVADEVADCSARAAFSASRFRSFNLNDLFLNSASSSFALEYASLSKEKLPSSKVWVGVFTIFAISFSFAVISFSNP